MSYTKGHWALGERKNEWLASHVALMMERLAEGDSFEQIGERLGRTGLAIERKFRDVSHRDFGRERCK